MTTRDLIKEIRAEIERLNNLNKQIAKEQGSTDFILGITAGYAEVLSFLDTLQVPEVDLEKEIEKWIDNNGITREDLSIHDLKSAAKHFYELGKNAK